MKFSDKFVAFVDILGFSNMVEAAEAGRGKTLAQIMALCEALAQESDAEMVRTRGPRVCPQSRFIRRDLDYQVTQISDCVVISAEVSPAGAIQIVSHCWSTVLSLLQENVLVRGYLTRGSVYHNGSRLIGSAYQNAYKKESDKEDGIRVFSRDEDDLGTPFIEIDPAVSEYVAAAGDRCVREMYSRFVETDEQGLDAIFPFKRLAHSFPVDEDFDPEREKRHNDMVRGLIRSMHEGISAASERANPSARRKSEHYLAALDRQLAACDDVDKAIDQLGETYPPPSPVQLLPQEVALGFPELTRCLKGIPGLNFNGRFSWLDGELSIGVSARPSPNAVRSALAAASELGFNSARIVEQ